MDHAHAEVAVAASDGQQHAGGTARVPTVEIGLNAAIVAVRNAEPLILTVRQGSSRDANDFLPSGHFSPLEHRTFEMGLRSWVRHQTGLELGYAEQLYTFGDRGRHAQQGDAQPHVVSIGYLALTRPTEDETLSGGQWREWYRYFPWEDWRKGKPEILASDVEPRLRTWAELGDSTSAPERPLQRTERLGDLLRPRRFRLGRGACARALRAAL